MSLTRADIEACKDLDLWRICEQTGRRTLRIELADNDDDTEPGRLFEVTWPSYVTYQIGDESMGYDGAHEVYDGSKFRCYTKSSYLDYVASTSLLDVCAIKESGDWPRVRHWAIYCLDHTIDVTTKDEPQIRLLEPPHVWAEQRQTAKDEKRIFEETLRRNREQSILSTIQERLKRR